MFLKKIVSIIISIVLLGTPYPSYGASIYTGIERGQILQGHNKYRSQVGVKRLKWSNTLAKNSLKYAQELEKNNCPFEHSSTEFRGYYGENLYAQWSTYGMKNTMKARNAVRVWGEERIDYTYETNSCTPGKICGHYTQMVWAGTTEVGCSVAVCTNTRLKTEILVCHYNPPGNYIGQSPY